MTDNAQKILFSYEKKAIPYLIEHMDDKKLVCILTFLNPLISTIPKYLCENHIGIRHAYIIEFILSEDSIETVNKTWNENENFLHWEEVIKPYRIYDNGVIVKQDRNGNPILEPLTYKDMELIKKMYLDWWKENKEKTIERLRSDYRKGKMILKFPYIWI